MREVRNSTVAPGEDRITQLVKKSGMYGFQEKTQAFQSTMQFKKSLTKLETSLSLTINSHGKTNIKGVFTNGLCNRITKKALRMAR